MPRSRSKPWLPLSSRRSVPIGRRWRTLAAIRIGNRQDRVNRVADCELETETLQRLEASFARGFRRFLLNPENFHETAFGQRVHRPPVAPAPSSSGRFESGGQGNSNRGTQ